MALVERKLLSFDGKIMLILFVINPPKCVIYEFIESLQKKL